jgi:DNA gyrase subunit A
MEVLAEDEIMIITKSGMIIRSPVSQVRVAGRNTQGVKLVNLDGGDIVTAVARVVPDDGKEAGVEGEDVETGTPEGGDNEQGGADS